MHARMVQDAAVPKVEEVKHRKVEDDGVGEKAVVGNVQGCEVGGTGSPELEEYGGQGASLQLSEGVEDVGGEQVEDDGGEKVEEMKRNQNDDVELKLVEEMKDDEVENANALNQVESIGNRIEDASAQKDDIQ